VVGELRLFPAVSASARPGHPWTGAGADVPRHGLERRFLREIPVSRYAPIAQAWASQVAQQPGFAPDARPRLDLSLLNVVLPGLSVTLSRSRPRRNVGRDDRFFALLAREYVDRLAARSISPVADIARRRDLKSAHVRDLLHEARVRGVLTAAKPGRREGALTAYGLTLLRSMTTTRRKR
jgi:hypothetical protein